MEKRRNDVQGYSPPSWSSNYADPVSGQIVEVPMVEHANIVFIGPTGSGKSSLIGSLYRAVNEVDTFPELLQRTLNHPDKDSHGTMCWLETYGNTKRTIVYQDTRGDQKYDAEERTVHEFSLRGFYRDGAPLVMSSFLSRDWWTSQKFFWERTLSEIPHCVVFVFDGSSDPFLDSESLEFFKAVFEDCTRHGYEPAIVVTCVDLIYQDALNHGQKFEVQLDHKRENVLQAFEDLNLTRQSVYFVTNFHQGHRGVKIWDPSDRGFDMVTKKMVDLNRELLSLADRFIKSKYNQRSSCGVL
eukprot:Em0020g29a